MFRIFIFVKAGWRVGRILEPGLETEQEDRLYSSGEAIQFSPDLFPSSLLNLPDYAHISELLSKSQYGIRFDDEGLYDELLEMIYVLLLQDDSDSFDIFWNSDEPVPGTRK